MDLLLLLGVFQSRGLSSKLFRKSTDSTELSIGIEFTSSGLFLYLCLLQVDFTACYTHTPSTHAGLWCLSKLLEVFKIPLQGFLQTISESISLDGPPTFCLHLLLTGKRAHATGKRAHDLTVTRVSLTIPRVPRTTSLIVCRVSPKYQRSHLFV